MTNLFMILAATKDPGIVPKNYLAGSSEADHQLHPKYHKAMIEGHKVHY